MPEPASPGEVMDLAAVSEKGAGGSRLPIVASKRPYSHSIVAGGLELTS